MKIKYMYNNPAEKDSILNELAETPHTRKKGNFSFIVWLSI
jgi:hypothetical protein